MGVVKTRGAARKLGPIGLGRKFVSFKINTSDRHFTIQEDLLCNNSKVFKIKLQENRKAVEGECDICREVLDPEVDDITFCRSTCGQNVHEKCIATWKATRASPMTCPICWKIWRQGTDEVFLVRENLDPKAVQVYLDWLYTWKLWIVKSSLGRCVEHYITIMSLFQAWTVSNAFQDCKFAHLVAAKLVSCVENIIDARYDEDWEDEVIGYIDYAYGICGSKLMQRFIIDLYLARVKKEDLDGNMRDCHADFKKNLLVAAVQRMQMPTYSELLKKHSNRDYKMEGNVEEDEIADDGEDGEKSLFV